MRNATDFLNRQVGIALFMIAIAVSTSLALAHGASSQGKPAPPPPPPVRYAVVPPGAGADVIAGSQAIQGTGVPNLVVTAQTPIANLAVGLTHTDGSGNCVSSYYVQAVRGAYTVYDKCHDWVAPGFQAVPIGNLFSSVGNGCSVSLAHSVPVTYDRKYDRWIFSATPPGTSPLSWCFAVSQTSDPTGPYYAYAIPLPNFGGVTGATIPKTAIWPTGYFMTFQTSNGGSEVCAMDRPAAVAGSVPAIECQLLPANSGSVIAADQDGSIEPAGAEYIVGLGANKLNIWRFAPNFASPSAADLTGPTAIPVNSFTQACVACIPQPGTTQQLRSYGYWPMYRFAYRSIGGVNYLTVNHSVAPSQGNKQPFSGIRWYLMTVATATSTPAIAQQGTFAPDSTSRWTASMAMDKCGDIGIGYSVSSTSVYPGIRFAGRTPGDSANTLESEIPLLNGAYSQVGDDHWGLSSDMRVDPSDETTFYYTNQYLTYAGNTNWSTAISKVRFSTCP